MVINKSAYIFFLLKMQKDVLKNFQNRFYYYNSAIKNLQKKGNVWTVLLPSAFPVDFATSKKKNEWQTRVHKISKNETLQSICEELSSLFIKAYNDVIGIYSEISTDKL